MAEEQADLKITPAGAPEGAKAQNPLDVQEKKQDDSDIVSSIVKNETEEQKSILEQAPQLDESLLDGMEPPKSGLLSVLKLLFGLLVILGVVGFVFFKVQLSSGLDALTAKLNLENVSQDLSSTNAEIIKLQTEKNFNNYLQIKGYMDILAYHADGYIQNYNVAKSQTASQAEKREAEEKLVELNGLMNDSVLMLKDLYAQSFTAPLVGEELDVNEIFQRELLTLIQQEAKLVEDGEEAETKREYKNLQQMARLVGNQKLKNLLIKTDFAAMEGDGIYQFTQDLNQTYLSDLSIIQQIKKERIKWSDIINEIELRTIAVDSYYTDDYYDELGGILYTSYDFEKNSKTISIVGETKRFDTTNFTMIANLIDELNRSEFFSDGEMRSFTKSGSLNEGYTSILKLNLKLTE